MKIRWLVFHGGFNGPHYPGDLSEVEDVWAGRLIAVGAAEPEDKAAAPPPPPPPGTSAPMPNGGKL